MNAVNWRTVMWCGCASLAASSACSRVDVYAITETRVNDETSKSSSDDGDSTALDADVGTNSPSSADASPNHSAPSPTQAASSESGRLSSASEPTSIEPTSTSSDGSVPPARDCSFATIAAGDHEFTIDVNGTARSYVLHVPSTYDGTQEVPLIVDFHGMGGTGESELGQSPYPPVTDPEGVIIAFPDGMQGPLGTAWNLGPCCVEDVDDVAFAKALVAHALERACIDPRRVYAVGVLTGGGLVNTLACEAADVFAAAAPAAFDLVEETANACAPARPITVISFRGTDDTRVPYQGGPSSVVPGMPITFLGAVGSFARWADINGCTEGPSEQDVDGCTSYSGCDEGVEVVLCTKPGGHSEPGDARIAWPVLKRHSL